MTTDLLIQPGSVPNVLALFAVKGGNDDGGVAAGGHPSGDGSDS